MTGLSPSERQAAWKYASARIHRQAWPWIGYLILLIVVGSRIFVAMGTGNFEDQLVSILIPGVLWFGVCTVINHQCARRHLAEYRKSIGKDPNDL